MLLRKFVFMIKTKIGSCCFTDLGIRVYALVYNDGR